VLSEPKTTFVAIKNVKVKRAAQIFFSINTPENNL
jgi:hypothetical protein